MASDLSSASPEVQAFCQEIAQQCEPQVREALSLHQNMMAAPTAGAPVTAGVGGLDLSQLPAIVKVTLDLAVQFAGQPLETLIVSQKAFLREFVSQKVIDYVRQVANDLSDHPVMRAMRGQGPAPAEAATG
jgi:hypothetical protein